MNFSRHTRRAAAGAVVALVTTATAASASERFASPTGTGLGCTQAQPCDIVTAINNAANHDDITIEPGTYGSPTPISTPLSDNSKMLAIHGVTGQPMPVIHTDASQFGIGLAGGGSLSYVDIEDSSNTLRTDGIEVVSKAASVDHVISHTTGSNHPIACGPIGTLIDSLCWSSGPNGSGASLGQSGPMTQSSALINDTLIGSGSGSYGLLELAVGTFTTTVTMTNSIARGMASDIYMDSTTNSTAILSADHSNYGSLGNAMAGGTVTPTIPGSGSNQTAAPNFVDAASGNFREVASSPTVNAGVVDSFAGTTDLDGNPRLVGTFTDIGAYEFIPAPICSNLTATVPFATARTLQLSCQDAINSPLTYSIATNPAHGKLTLNATSGAATYTPNAGFSGHDSFTYTAADAHGTAAASTVSLTVGPEPKPMISHFKQHKGTFSFTLNEAANVTLTFRRHGHTRGTLTIGANAGPNTFHFKGLLSNGKHLAPGRYSVVATAVNAGGSSSPKRVSFKLSHR